MKTFKSGQMVGIPCQVGMGAFAGEHLVTFMTKTGPVSGFVRSADMLKVSGDTGMLRGIVEEEGTDTLTVRVVGSFFTTTGLAYLEREWAASNLQPVSRKSASS